MTDVRARFAPSPTGTLHIGSARTALYNYLFARHMGGVMVLRIEDTDIKRSLREHEDSIVSDLAWLGLHADEGPDTGGAFGPYRQSERGPLYEEGILRLLAAGHAYRCFCSQERLDELKAEQLARSEMPKYDRRCLHLSPETVAERLAAGEEATVRFQVPEGDVTFADLIHGEITFSSDVIGDFILKRTDGGFSYNYAVVIDDAGMKITHVIRGEDHITNTARQLMLYEALGEPAPRYAHHSLILGRDHAKLSKRHGATSIGDFQGMGYLSAAVVNYLALLSWHPGDEREKFTLDEVIPEFDIERVSKSPAIFDVDKLNWLNGLYLRELEAGALADLIRPYLEPAGLAFAPEQEAIVAAAVQANLVTLADAPTHAAVFAADVDVASSPHRSVLATPGVAAVLETLRGLVEEFPAPYVEVQAARDALHRLSDSCKAQGIKGKAIFQPVRVALTGETQGPELFYLVAGLGKDRVLARLSAAEAIAAGGEG